MPTYEYKCPVCGREEEIVKKLSEFDRVEHCPQCISLPAKPVPMERIISKSSFQLKGPGWFNSGGY